MAGSASAAGISPIISFNRTGGKKKKKQTKTKCYFHTSLTSQLIFPVRRWLQVAFPTAFLPVLWHLSQPGPGSCVPTVASRATGIRQEGWSEEALHRRSRAWQGRHLLPWGVLQVPSHSGDPQQVP